MATICAILPPAGLILFWLSLGPLAPASKTVTATLSLLVPGTVATTILALSLRAIGVRSGNWYQFVALVVTLFAVSAVPFTVLAGMAARSLQPGW